MPSLSKRRSLTQITSILIVLTLPFCQCFITQSRPKSIFGINAFKDFSGDEKEFVNENASVVEKKLQQPPSPNKEGGGRSGRITMVGSGPGDPDLLTMAAHKLLADKSALVIADRLVSPEILELVQGEIKTARKYPGCAEMAQEEIYEWVDEGLGEGRHVIRLKIGDPFVFGRGGEEVLRFRSMGYEPVVIPGVSATFSAPLLGGIPVTHRGIANQVVMCTGYGRNGTSPDLIQYHKEQTVVFLMAVGRLNDLSDNLQKKAGYPPHTPVAIVEKAGCPAQRTIVGDLTTIADMAKEYEIKPPSTIVVGECVHVLLEDFGQEEKWVKGLIPKIKSQVISDPSS